MLPRTLRELSLVAMYGGLFTLISFYFSTGERPIDGATFGVLVLAGLLYLAYSWGKEFDEATDAAVRANEPEQPKSPGMPAADGIDIWSVHKRLMLASGQRLPDRPELNNDVFLYFALTLEELSEMARSFKLIITETYTASSDTSHQSLLVQAATAEHALHTMSKSMREVLTWVPHLRLPLNLTQAARLLDDTTDVTVTAAGLPLAAGLPAYSGYAEVQRSNLSKANPETGVIDKDPSGKWIKGKDFRAPKLTSVVAVHLTQRT